jgi:LysM repeat protein
MPAQRIMICARASLLLGIAIVLASCRSPSQKLDLAPDMIATPPHRLARTEYPFDTGGRYVDAWAAEGAGRFGRHMNSDRTEDGRTGDEQPERRPTPPLTPVVARPPTRAIAADNRPDPSPPATPVNRTATKPPAAKPPAAKPTAQKPPAKKKTTHTVRRGDSLSSLSRRYGVSVQAIKKANNLKSDRIIDGRKLVIPGA